jgi:hypothetical protein
MALTKRPRAKVIPLKTTAQLHADNILMAEELNASREQVGRQQTAMDRMAVQYTLQKTEFARLLVDFRNIVAADDTATGRLPIRTRLMTMLFPKFMLRQAARGARGRAWARIVCRLNEYTFQREHDVQPAIHTTATTVKVEKSEK